MNGLIGGRTASDMPGLDIAELRSWHNFLEAALRLSAALNGSLVDQHDLRLIEVGLLDILNTSPTGSARMGDLAEALLSSPSRATRMIGRLERRGLVRRETSPDDGRGVLATITAEGRTAAEEAMITYGDDRPLIPLPGFLIKKGAKGLMDTATEGLRERVLKVKKGP